MKRTLILLKKVIIAGVISIVLLSAFCVFYNYDGIHVVSESGATDYVWENGQLKATMKEGFSWIHMDSNGYNNISDYSDKPDILLMGSSHMEAAQVAKDENVGYLLNAHLDDYHTYNIGMSGHTIYRCMDNLENALQTYNPQKYVVIVVDSVDLSVSEMKSVVEDKASPIPSYDSGVIYHLQKIPAIKVIYKQINDWILLEGNVNKGSSKVALNNGTSMKQEYNHVLTEFLGKATDLCEEAGVTLIMVYQPAQKLEGNGVVYEYSERQLQIFENECDSQGIIFCDMTQSFDELFYEEHRLAHGFSNSSVGEGHLNKYGHAAVANMIVSKIQELEAQ